MPCRQGCTTDGGTPPDSDRCAKQGNELEGIPGIPVGYLQT